MSSRIVYTQDQLDKQARELGLVRVVPVGMRDIGHNRDGAMPTSWFYSDRIREISENYTTAYDSGGHRKRTLARLRMED